MKLAKSTLLTVQRPATRGKLLKTHIGVHLILIIIKKGRPVVTPLDLVHCISAHRAGVGRCSAALLCLTFVRAALTDPPYFKHAG